jgi:hypothetical protein
MKLYEVYQGEELRIAELIQRRRLQMLVHSYIYYELDNNLVSDSTWSAWAVELRDLQNQYPEIAKTVPYGEGFEEWNGSTGAFLPYNTVQIQVIAERLMGNTATKVTKIKLPPKPVVTKKTTARKKLF